MKTAFYTLVLLLINGCVTSAPKLAVVSYDSELGSKLKGKTSEVDRVSIEKCARIVLFFIPISLRRSDEDLEKDLIAKKSGANSLMDVEREETITFLYPFYLSGCRKISGIPVKL